MSKIFGKGASDLRFEPGKSSTPTRDDFKRNNSVGSTGSLDSDKDSSKKLRLDLSPSSNSPEAADEMAEDSGGSKPLPNLPDDDISEIKIVSGDSAGGFLSVSLPTEGGGDDGDPPQRGVNVKAGSEHGMSSRSGEDSSVPSS